MFRKLFCLSSLVAATLYSEPSMQFSSTIRLTDKTISQILKKLDEIKSEIAANETKTGKPFRGSLGAPVQNTKPLSILCYNHQGFNPVTLEREGTIEYCRVTKFVSVMGTEPNITASYTLSRENLSALETALEGTRIQEKNVELPPIPDLIPETLTERLKTLRKKLMEPPSLPARCSVQKLESEIEKYCEVYVTLNLN